MNDSQNIPLTNTKPEVVSSPCIGVCALDEDDLCIGCFRSVDEIRQWGKADNDGKRQILKQVAERMAHTSGKTETNKQD